MKTRILTALVLIALLLPCVYFGGIAFQALVLFVVGAATFEMLSICSRPKARLYLYPLIGCFIFYSVFFENKLMVSSEMIVIYMIILLCCSMFDESMSFLRLAYYFTAAVLIAMGLHMIYQLRLTYGIHYLLLLALATFGSDTGAYFAGLKFGKHKLNPRLSPKKTIEGSIGGILLGSILSFAFATYTHIDIPLLPLLFTCVILTITGQVGDLTFSSIKRTFEVKDYSQLLPGHGGVLDRFDSILFNSMVLGLILHCLSLMGV